MHASLKSFFMSFSISLVSLVPLAQKVSDFFPIIVGLLELGKVVGVVGAGSTGVSQLCVNFQLGELGFSSRG